MPDQAARHLELLAPSGSGANTGSPTRALELAVALTQHHDAITGTEKQAVANDYHRRLAEGVRFVLVSPRSCCMQCHPPLCKLHGSISTLPTCYLQLKGVDESMKSRAVCMRGLQGCRRPAQRSLPAWRPWSTAAMTPGMLATARGWACAHT
jgi:hypothetical protein